MRTSTSRGRVRVLSAVSAITQPPGSLLEKHYTQGPLALPLVQGRPPPNRPPGTLRSCAGAALPDPRWRRVPAPRPRSTLRPGISARVAPEPRAPRRPAPPDRHASLPLLRVPQREPDAPPAKGCCEPRLQRRRGCDRI